MSMSVEVDINTLCHLVSQFNDLSTPVMFFFNFNVSTKFDSKRKGKE